MDPCGSINRRAVFEALSLIPTDASKIPERPIDAVVSDRREKIAARRCTVCPGHADYFKDVLSVKEYFLSGMCQSCQDVTFVSEPD